MSASGAGYRHTSRSALPHGSGLGVYLAWSVDRRTSLSSHIAPGGGVFYVVRRGVDSSNVARGCSSMPDRDEAEREFLEAARGVGGTWNDPDSIEVSS